MGKRAINVKAEHKKNVDNKRKPKTVALQDTDEIDVFLHYKTDDKNEITEVWGYGVIHNTRDRADGCKDHHRKVYYGDVASAESGVSSDVLQDWRWEKRGAYAAIAGKPTSLQDSLRRVLDEDYDKVLGILRQETGYADSTARSAISYLVNSIARNIESPDEDLHGVYDKLCLQAEKSSGENYSAATRRSVGNEIRRAEKAFRVIKAIYPQELLYYPVLRIPVPDMGRAVDKEQKKSITQQERVITASALLELAREGVPHAFGASFMLFTGLRRGEAAAPRMEEIVGYENDQYGSYLVAYQMQHGSELVRLKTDESCRWIVLPRIAMEFYRIRRSQLIAKGFTEAEIKKIPYTSTTDEEDGFIQPGQLSFFLRKILTKSGIEKDKFRATDEEEANFVETFEDGDYVGHLSRRDFAGRCLNTCGVSPALTDYLLGHKSSELGSRLVELNAASQQWAKETAAMLERYVFLPEFSGNPAVVPVKLRAGLRYRLRGNLECSFTAEEDCLIRISIHNAEPDDGVQIVSDKAPLSRTLKTGRVIDMSEGRKDRFAPQRSLLRADDYPSLIAEGKRIAYEILEEGWDS